MKIIQIGSYPISPDCIRGGVEASVYGLAQILSQSHDVVVFDFPRINGKDIVEKDGVKVYRYANAGTNQVDMVRRLERITEDILREQPDVCHIHGTGLISYFLYKKLRKYGVNLMLTVHGLLFVEKKKRLKAKFSIKNLLQFIYQSITEFRLLNIAPHTIVDTHYVDKVLHDYPCRVPQIYIIPQGVNNAYFQRNCSADSNIILSVGSISARKGYIYALKAFEQMRNRGVKGKWVICGIVAEQAYYEQLMEAVKKSPYAADIELKVNVPITELMAEYESAHVFMLHSQEESQGIVFAEAMACGMPVVATNIGGIPYVVIQGESGLLSDYTDSQTMADHLEQLMTDFALWQQMSCNARQAAKQYDWNTIAEKIVELYCV